MPQAAGTLTEFAAHFGVSAPYVTKLKKQGRLVMVTVDGKELVDFAMTEKLIRNTTDPAKAENGANAKLGAGSRVVQDVGSGNRLDLTYKQARTHEAAFRAKLTELEFREREGLLVEADKIKRSFQKHLQQFVVMHQLYLHYLKLHGKKRSIMKKFLLFSVNLNSEILKENQVISNALFSIPQKRANRNFLWLKSLQLPC
jgi:hypothetical protein